MATPKTKKTETNTDTGNTNTTEALTAAEELQKMLEKDKEDGFQAITFADLHYYRVQSKEGNPHILYCIPLQRKERADKAGFYYIVGVTRDCTLYNRDSEPVQVKGGPDTYAWVDERTALECLQEYLPKQANHGDGTIGIVQCSEVRIIPKEKIKLRSGRTMWQFAVAGRGLVPNSSLPLLAPATSSPPSPGRSDDDGDIPF